MRTSHAPRAAATHRLLSLPSLHRPSLAPWPPNQRAMQALHLFASCEFVWFAVLCCTVVVDADKHVCVDDDAAAGP